MGRASNRKKQGRASGPRGRPGGRNYLWPLSLGLIVLAGVGLVVASRGGSGAARLPPLVGDHWHAAYGVYDCDTLLGPFPDSMAASRSGIHTHADGLIHLEVNSSRYSGPNANLAAFAEGVDVEISDTRLSAPGTQRAEGDECGNASGDVRLAVWEGANDETPTIITKDIADYAPQNGQLVTIAFAPASATIPKPSPEAVSGLGGQGG